jgi:hypothetical protein
MTSVCSSACELTYVTFVAGCEFRFCDARRAPTPGAAKDGTPPECGNRSAYRATARGAVRGSVRGGRATPTPGRMRTATAPGLPPGNLLPSRVGITHLSTASFAPLGVMITSYAGARPRIVGAGGY